MGKRLAGLIVTGEQLAQCIATGGVTAVVSSPLPASAEYVTAYFDHRRNAFMVVFEDESFGLLSDGSVIPILGGLCELKTLEWEPDEPCAGDECDGYLSQPNGEGWWVFREQKRIAWRLTHVSTYGKAYVATGPWLTESVVVSTLRGHWCKVLKPEYALFENDYPPVAKTLMEVFAEEEPCKR